ncbi:sulfatase-like hydrolase/transferase [Flavobacteriaceae bacterium]|nr:sulfatase-like hydrolase/transferase [Flavobacteriaceae bacterium]
MKYFLSFILLVFINCNSKDELKQKPNVILIMADDIGFECLSINGSTSYKTPVLDSLALNGINFTKAISQPLCTPSRVKIMTGKHNFRNYEHFTYLNSNQKTFGNLFKENGYKTAIVGKWQLNGIKIKAVDKNISQDNKRPHEFGFDEYSLWQLTKTKDLGERFANPLIEQNGKFLPRNENAYGPDVVSDYAVDFIKRNKDNPFFIYYPMLLVHDPFVPTPDSPEWKSLETRSEKDNKYFVDMVAYMDKIIGKIVDELEAQGIAENTLLLFVGDNGTHTRIISQTENGSIRGGKGNTISHGVNVPMVASWPSIIKKSRNYLGLVNFNDFYATFTDILNVENDSDGESLVQILKNKETSKRETVSIYYDPMWGNISRYRNVFSQTKRYKLYQNGEFFDMEKDILETNPLNNEDLSENEKRIKAKLSFELELIPQLPKK